MSFDIYEQIHRFELHLRYEEKAETTVGKYCRDVESFCLWLDGREFTKSLVLEYKSILINKYATASINAAISSLNRFFDFIGNGELKMKSIRKQKETFASTDKELSRSEYERLIVAARKSGKKRLSLLMQTICACGIRVSELRFITVRAVSVGIAEIDCKGKRRRVYLPAPLCALLRVYIREKKIKSGAVFVSKNGIPLDRSNIWCEMKKLCREAGVSDKKVFPHNLRHLFARTYYSRERDIVRLADILGHTSIDTTRIYTIESGEVHRRQIQGLDLVLERRE